MAVSKMKLVNISGSLEALGAVTRACGESGVFQPDDTLSYYSDTSAFSVVREENPFTAPLSALHGCLQNAGLKPDAHAKAARLSDGEAIDFANTFVAEVDEITAARNACDDRIAALKAEREQFEHLRGLNIDFESVLHCKTIKVRFGRLPLESYRKLGAYDDNPYVLFFPGACDTAYYWGVYFAPVDFAEEVDRIFSSMYFERMHIPDVEGTPEEILAEMTAKTEALQKERADTQAQLQMLWKEKSAECSSVCACLQQCSACFDIRRYAARYADKFTLNGWVLASEENTLKKRMADIADITVTFKPAEEDGRHTPPVALKNPRIFRPFEYLVGMYGLPCYNEIDPTAFVAITYTLLFGVMFGDVGQGLLVALVGWLMWKCKKMDIGRILIPCGISSAAFGLVYGSVFGFEHLLDPMYKALFGLNEKPIEVMASATATRIIVTAVAIGFVLIVVSMLLNIVSALRRRDFETGLFGASGIAGLVFYTSLVAGLVCQLVLKIRLMTLPYVLLLIVLPVLLIFLREPLGKLVSGKKDWLPESIGDFILQNFFELFETMLSYLSNTMSFLRVGAFVLVHAGMMMAVFALANIFGTFGYTVTVILGNGLVMVMEALLVAIQVMRLQFYEMFSRYYIGEGRSFEPVKLS